jgi:hypothetical protein
MSKLPERRRFSRIPYELEMHTTNNALVSFTCWSVSQVPVPEVLMAQELKIV